MKKFLYSIMILSITFTSCDCTNCSSSYVGADTLVTTVDTCKPLDKDELCLTILDDIFRNFYGEKSPNPVLENGKFKVSVKKISDYRLKYKIVEESEEDISLKFCYSNTYGYPVKIHIKKDGDFVYLVNVYDLYLGHKDIVYDIYGNRITLAEQIKNNEHRLSSILKPIEKIKDDDKDIFAAILSSKGMENVDYIEYDDYMEIFCENNEAAYRFLIKESRDSSGYWGIINKMMKPADLQTDTTDGSSSIYAFKALNKSTSTKRFMISLVRVIQEDIDDTTNNQKKYGETSNTHHVVNDYVVARHGGIFSGGVAILATNEDTFVKKYLSEVSENIVYTYDGEQLKLNGRSAYAGKVNKLWHLFSITLGISMGDFIYKKIFKFLSMFLESSPCGLGTQS